jgi:hypothetical protein
VAAVGLCAWSHPGRCRTDAAFAMLGGAAPIPASSGQTVRVRRNRSGDRQLNQALDTVVLTRLRTDPTTRADALRRRARARPSVRSSAAWSATSPASSTGNSRPDQQLTQHRSVHRSKRCPGSGTSGLRPGPAIIPTGFNLFGVDPQVRVWFAASYLPQRLQIPAAAAFIVVGALAVWWATAIQRTSTGDR